MEITLWDLEKCASLAREAEDLRERMERLRAMAQGGSIRLSFAPGGGGPSDTVANAVANLDELERKASEKIGAYLCHVQCVETIIDSVPDADQRRILRMRYVDGLTWEVISDKTQYTDRWCRALKNRGLEALGLRESQKRVPVNSA